MSDRPFRVLSLSGGGIRGIFQAVYLARLAEHFPGPIYKYFDLVCGTSTGAIVALAVAIGIEPKEIVKAYREKGGLIFQSRTMGRFREGGRYDSKPLTNTLSSLFGDKKLSDARTDLVITATPIDDFGHKVFTTLNGLDGPDCKSLLAAEIVAASASAPTYFPPTKPKNSERAYVDGGLWANSPATVGILAAHRIKGIPFRSMRLLTVGNGKLPGGATLEKFSSLRALSLTTIDAVLELMFSSQESFADDNACLLLGSSNVIAVNAALDEEIALDNVKSALKRLPSLAEKEADRTKDDFGELFASTASSNVQGSSTRLAHAPSADHLVSRDLVKAAGLTAFFPARKYYGSHRREGESISAYVGTARKSIAMVSVNLMTGLPFDDLAKTLQGKLAEPHSISVVVSLLDPRVDSLMSAICPALDMEHGKLSSMIFESLEKLVSLRDTVVPERRHNFQIRVHKSIPFGSAILLDADDVDGRIQIETKPYKVPSQRSFGFEVMRANEDGLYESLLEGYRALMADGEEISPVFFRARSTAVN